ncbi:hypothetical protein CSB09_02750 [Candidatus Gracilibacteria bacterium]|nr:MAG: hypothetical protein CSB09_02750 [Candidatus Gracilibacteria bacterium]
MNLVQNTSSKSKKPNIQFTLNTIIAGSIDFTFRIDKQQFDGVFSEIFDPLADLKAWLEAISVGVQQASCRFIADGSKISFNFEKTNENEGIFILREVYENEFIPPLNIQSTVYKKELIRAIYTEFIDFFGSANYDPMEWERLTYEDIICEQFDMDTDQILDELLGYSKKELDNIFVNICPKGKSPKKCVRIPDTYESIEKDKKIQQIQKILKINLHPFFGMKAKDFKSGIVETFLA